jgi:hypothetical protein
MNSQTSPKMGEDWSSLIKVPAPWSQKKVVESDHPLKDGLKAKDTIIIPDARQLFVKFDPQCASQYDYDKFVLFQGCGPSAKKIAEFGGNYYGCGNKNFAGPGWPRDIVRIDGNVMSYSFEMKSTRESLTSDKAVWGYLFSVYPKYDYAGQDRSLGDKCQESEKAALQAGFVSLISLHSIDVVHKIISRMVAGRRGSAAELNAKLLVQNEFAAR